MAIGVQPQYARKMFSLEVLEKMFLKKAARRTLHSTKGSTQNSAQYKRQHEELWTVQKAAHRTLDSTPGRTQNSGQYKISKTRDFTKLSRVKVSSVALRILNFSIPLEEHTYCRNGYALPIWIVSKDTQDNKKTTKHSSEK